MATALSFAVPIGRSSGAVVALRRDESRIELERPPKAVRYADDHFQRFAIPTSIDPGQPWQPPLFTSSVTMFTT